MSVPEKSPRTLVIACGAIARELVRISNASGWNHLDVQCLPPELHNRPERIPAAVRELLEARPQGQPAFVAYADCGTGGLLDRVLEEFEVERLPGAHCYEFLAGQRAFAQVNDQEPGSYYLTDFLVRHFERLVVQGLGLDRFPQLRGEYFRHYRRLVYLAQQRSRDLERRAEDQARFLGLDYVYSYCGDGPFRSSLAIALET